MGTPDKKLSEFVGIVRSWIPRRSEPANLSRDFWMPDQSCRVCYECDSQFTVFNRRHHCRLCGRVFCAKCASNSVPAPSDEPNFSKEERERVRVCNYCFTQWAQGLVPVDNGTGFPGLGLDPSPSATSLVSSNSSCTCNSSCSTVGLYPTGPYERVSYSSGFIPDPSSEMDHTEMERENKTCQRNINSGEYVMDSSVNDFGFYSARSDDEDDDYGIYHSDFEARPYFRANEYHGGLSLDEIENVYGLHKVHADRENISSNISSSTPLTHDFDASDVDKTKKKDEEADDHDKSNEGGEAIDDEPSVSEPVDFENNGLLWLPPEPADEEDDREAALIDDDDEDDGARGEWSYLRSSNSFGSGENRSRDKSGEEHRNAMKNVVEGHFRALVAQLLQVVNLQMDDEVRPSWLDIITSLSWEAATLLKPDTSKSGGMDPGGYVKVKCIACGCRSESMVVRGVVCKKNVAHRRMTSKIEKPRLLILGGALEYQRVSNQLSSFDTLLQQEMDHLKMAVAKINVHNPDVLLVEKSVSRHAQEHLLAKDISLVLNFKRPLLERIARCTGAQIVASIDHLTSPKMGYCELFHVEKYFEEHGSAGQGGKKLTKTLMFFEGCPRPFGCTILLKGANGDELKKVKHVVQYGVFAAYHLALETSFLADEGATLPELPLKSPITVALPDKPSSIDKSISTIPSFSNLSAGKPSAPAAISASLKSNKDVLSRHLASTDIDLSPHADEIGSTDVSKGDLSKVLQAEPEKYSSQITDFAIPLSQTGQNLLTTYENHTAVDDGISAKQCTQLPAAKGEEATVQEKNQFGLLQRRGTGEVINAIHENESSLAVDHTDKSNLQTTNIEDNKIEIVSSKEEFHPNSDHQSILVSLSTRCIWKGTVCERAHLFRIKYYGSFDKPLGRYLRDHLFDECYRCQSCDMPSEAHVHCYTHHQGSLTISVKKLQETLPGEREGKIWMWHRCLHCPRAYGFPPATRRVVMSDAAWGLSFGKFLELSFSNHAAASRVASCGHSLHRDCLRFYGFGRMVACFRYAAINLHSVYLPPSMLEFNYDSQEWIENEANEVRNRAEVLFNELDNALYQLLEKTSSMGSQDGLMSEPKLCIVELQGMLRCDREGFLESFRNTLNRELKAGRPAIDILELIKLRRKILLYSYVWDLRLIEAATLVKKSITVSRVKERNNSVEKLSDISAAHVPTSSMEPRPDINPNQGTSVSCGGESTSVFKEKSSDQDTNNRREAEVWLHLPPDKVGNEDISVHGKLARRIPSVGELLVVSKVSDNLEAAGTSESNPATITPGETGGGLLPDSKRLELANVVPGKEMLDLGSFTSDRDNKTLENAQDITKSAPFTSSYTSFSSFNAQKLGIPGHSPVYVCSFQELERQSGARLLLPVGVDDTVVPVYDDEPTSIIAYALVSADYHTQMSESEKPKDAMDSGHSLLFLDTVNLLSFNSFDEGSFDLSRSFGSADESSASKASQLPDPSLYPKDLHVRVSFSDEGPLGKTKYTVTCYFAKRFESLRKTCCPSELDFILSLSRCKKWGAQGGKSNVFFAKTLDDRFIIKQVTKTELESFIKFGPAYFKYLTNSINSKSPTCLAKIVGIYQVSTKHFKGGKESKMDVLVMENLLFRRNITRLYDLKGSSRSRYNPDTSGSNKVLLDQNLIESMPTSPIFVGSKAKRLLERAVWNDTFFLASIDVMDYSLLVGVDEERHELVVGIIDFMRQYTWDKHLETWVKTSGILGGLRNASPTVISPQQYKKRFRKAMTTYFLMVPDQWSPPTVLPGGPQADAVEEKENNTQKVAGVS